MGFLALTRKVGEAIEIGPALTVEVVAIEDDSVELAVYRPRPGVNTTECCTVGDALALAEDVELHVTRVMGNKVRLAIKAPPAVRIWRTEVVRRDERRAA